MTPHQACAYHHASDLPEGVWKALLQNEAAATVIFPFARRALNFPRGGGKDQLWIVLYDDPDNVEFVLSCTKGPLGNYPIFIVPCRVQLAKEEDHDKDLTDALQLLARRLLDEVPPQRIFSVFSVARVANKFAEVFQDEVHARQRPEIRVHKEPYYDGTLAFCTKETFNWSLDPIFSPRESEHISISLRLADHSHLQGVRVLCKALHETLPPYLLDDAGAELEARTMITNKQAWVHVVEEDGQDPEIACLVVTDESDNIAAITKVFTAERWRGRGCATRLLHFVCQSFFQSKNRVVLFVGNSDELTASRRVYHKIGFRGLDKPRGEQVESTERWLEIGVEGTMLGFW